MLRVLGIGSMIFKKNIVKSIKQKSKYRVCIVGAGHLAMAIAQYKGFKKSQFSVVALFDVDRSKIGKRVGDCYVYDWGDFQKIVAIKRIDIAIITVSVSEVQPVLNEITKAGIKIVLNFAPVRLKVNKNIKIRNIDIVSLLKELVQFSPLTQDT